MTVGNGKIGDWGKVDRMLSGFGPKFKENIRAATNRNGRLLEGAIVGVIEQQKLSPPLKPAYKARKIRLGLSEQILIATGTLLQNIRYHRRSWDQGFVGVLRNVKGTAPTLTGRAPALVNIAAVHELGTKDGRVPARKPFARGQAEVEEKMVRNYEEAVERTFA